MFRKKKREETFNPKQVSSGRGKSNFIITTQRFQNQKNTSQLSSKDLKALNEKKNLKQKVLGN